MKKQVNGYIPKKKKKKNYTTAGSVKLLDSFGTFPRSYHLYLVSSINLSSLPLSLQLVQVWVCFPSQKPLAHTKWINVVSSSLLKPTKMIASNNLWKTLWNLMSLSNYLNKRTLTMLYLVKEKKKNSWLEMIGFQIKKCGKQSDIWMGLKAIFSFNNSVGYCGGF